MKWIIIVGGGCIVMYLLTILCKPLRSMFKWLISRKHRRRRKRLRVLTGRRDYLQGQLNKTTDEIRMIK